jgi:hypothetical protein
MTGIRSKPKRLAADTAYGTGKFLSWLIGTGITPHIPVRDMSQRDDGTFSRSDFTIDKDRKLYICPKGMLTTTGRVLFVSVAMSEVKYAIADTQRFTGRVHIA